MKNTKTYRFFRLGILAALYRVPLFHEYVYKRLPRHRAGYSEYWVNKKSKNYRVETLKEDQNASIMRYFPTPKELLRTIKAHVPATVFEVGCGYGRHLEALAPYFDVQGCDISVESLSKVRPDLKGKVFLLDIVNPIPGWIEAHREEFDVVFCWCVMMYFIDNRSQTVAVMKNMESLAKKKVIVWEWKHVCDYMRSVYASDKFEYHYIPIISAA